MGQVLHGSATVTEAIRRAIQHDEESRGALSKRYDSHQQLEAHLADFISAYNFGRRLKTLKGLTPCEFICKSWTAEPERFNLNQTHQMPGLNG